MEVFKLFIFMLFSEVKCYEYIERAQIISPHHCTSFIENVLTLDLLAIAEI